MWLYLLEIRHMRLGRRVVNYGGMEINMAKGFIYIMTNPALKGMVKIGYAKRCGSQTKTVEHYSASI